MWAYVAAAILRPGGLSLRKKKSQELEHSGAGQKEPGSSMMSLHHGAHTSGILPPDMGERSLQLQLLFVESSLINKAA